MASAGRKTTLYEVQMFKYVANFVDDQLDHHGDNLIYALGGCLIRGLMVQIMSKGGLLVLDVEISHK